MGSKFGLHNVDAMLTVNKNNFSLTIKISCCFNIYHIPSHVTLWYVGSVTIRTKKVIALSLVCVCRQPEPQTVSTSSETQPAETRKSIILSIPSPMVCLPMADTLAKFRL